MKTFYLANRKPIVFLFVLFIILCFFKESSAQLTIDNVIPTDINCNGDNDGSISITTSNNTGTVDYSIDGGLTWQVGSSFTSLSAGNYTIWTRDDIDTTIYASNPVTITEPTAVSISTVTPNNALCNGDANGEIIITASGGTGSLEYSIDDGTSYYSNGGIFSSLTAADYNIRVRDANGCEVAWGSNPVTITQPTAVTHTVVNTDITCFGAADGSIEVTASGGSGIYEFSKDNGITWTGIVANPFTFTDLADGDYNIVVQDDIGCIGGMSSETISEPEEVTDSIVVYDVTTIGGSDGSIEVHASGGDYNFEFSSDSGSTWTGFVGNPYTFSDLTAGNYGIMVRDGQACATANTTVWVNEPSGPVASYPFNANANDASGNGYNGVLYYANNADDRFNTGAAAYDFNPDSARVEIGTGLNLINGSGSFTIAAWIKSSELSGSGTGRQYTILAEREGGDNWQFAVLDNAMYFSYWDGGMEYMFQGDEYNVQIGPWQYVVVTYDGNDIRFYINENSYDAAINEKNTWNTGTINIDNNPSTLYIGTLFPGSDDFRGIIDDVEIYDRALSHEEIQNKFFESGYYPYRDVTFRVNMNYQILNGFFDPETETVDVAGWWNGFGGEEMLDPDGDGIYEFVWPNVVIGLYQEFKFRTNWNWDGVHDFPGQANREITIIDGENIFEAYINDEMLTTDMGVLDLVSPVSGCGLTASESIIVDVKNYGVDTVHNFDISYQINSGGYTTEFVNQILLQNDVHQYTFGSTIDLSAYNEYTIDIALDFTGDQVEWNDTIQYIVTNKPVISTFPYLEDFEGTHHWTDAGNNSSWEVGTPAGIVMDHAASGSNAWATNLSGGWNQQEQSYVVSPCFDFTSLSNPVVRMNIWRHTYMQSCAALQYSVDSGASWTHVGTNWTELQQNWYNADCGEIEFSGETQCWNGMDEDWIVVQQMFDGLAGEANVLFRLVFGSDDGETGSYDGFAFDDFEVFDLPANDAKLLSINIGSDCGLNASVNIEVDVKNMGTDPISNFDVYYQIDGNAPVPEIFSGTLNQFESSGFTFSTTGDFSTEGQEYTLKVWTALAGEENYENDTVIEIIAHKPVVTTFPYTEDFEISPYYMEDYGQNSSWEIGPPSAGLINTSHSGSNVLATNLSGPSPFNEQSYTESECFDFSGLTHPIIEFWMWRDLAENDHGVSIQYSVDFGNWETLGSTGDLYNWFTQYPNDNEMYFMDWSGNVQGWNATSDSEWVYVRHTLDGLGGASNVRFGFVHHSPENWEGYEGVAIDDISIYEAPANDLFVYEISNPVSGPDLTSNEQVSIRIVNAGSAATSGDYAIHLFIDDIRTIDDTISTVINPGDTLDYDFSELSDFSTYQTYELKVSVTIPGDGFNLNDTIVQSITNTPVISSYPYLQDFEGTQYWTVGGTDPSWELGVPVGAVISYAASGSNVWVTSLDGYANQNEQSYIESPYFDFTSLAAPHIKLNYWSHGEWNEGVALQYSDDNGQNWYTVGAVGDAENWYNNGVDALSFLNTNDGWSDYSNGWVYASHALDGLGGMSNVKLRFVGAFWGNEVEFGIDNIVIYDGDQDGGVIALSSPNTGCGLSSNETIDVEIKNYGSNTISSFDVTYWIAGQSSVTETFTGSIDPGNTDYFAFSTTADLSALGTYEIRIWTSIPGDGFVDNDTLATTVNNNPVVSTFPYEQDFEGVHYWSAQGQNSSWELGTPSGSVINSANSGANAWATNLSGEFNHDEQSWVEGPCFDFSALSDPYVEISFWRYTEHDAGAALQYSLDGGNTWNQIGNHWETPNWYEDNIGALDFTGSQAAWAGWATKWAWTYHSLDGLAGASDVRLRVVFGSDASANLHDGFAFDDIKIYDRPEHDARLYHINVQAHCDYNNFNINFELENRGTNFMDSIQMFFQINEEPAVSEYFYPNINPDEPWGAQFADYASCPNIGETYQLKVWTALSGDMVHENDTMYQTIVPKPLINSYPYVEDFEGGDGYWTSQSKDNYNNNSWTLGTPAGSIINNAASGSNAWSTIPAVRNSNEKSVIVSPCFDLSGLITPAIEFKMWRDLALEEHGVAIQYSITENTWNTLGVVGDTLNWYTTHPGDPNFMNHFESSNDSWNATSDLGWITAKHSLEELAGQTEVKFRFVYANYNTSFHNGEGFAFDDIQIYENAFPDDAAAITLLGEESLPYRTSTEDIQFVLRNNGINEITSLDVSYQVDGGSIITETISTPIPSGEHYTYTFTQTADISAVGEYSIKLWTSLPGDQLMNNDTIEVNIYTTPVISTFPYTEDFESGNGYWYADGDNSSWEVGVPDEFGQGLNIGYAYSGSNAWATNLNGLFSDYENSYVVSPGFDLTNMQMPFIEIQKWSAMDDWNAGAAVQYSIDTGATWQTIGEVYDDTNWYNIESSWAVRYMIPFPRHCWSGHDAGWVMASHDARDVATRPLVMFRIAFGSDQNAHFEGFAFDDIRIYDGAPDYNASITNLATNAPECQPGNAEEVTVDIINRGLNPISDFNIYLSINEENVAYEYIGDVINPGDTLHYTFAQQVALSGEDHMYNIKIDACIDYPADGFGDDNCASIQPAFYGNFNDPWAWTNYYKCNSDIHDNTIYDIVQGDDGDLWMTSQKGVSRFDGSTWIHYSDTNQLEYNYTWNLFKDDAGNIWLPATQNDTITQYNGANFIVHAVPAVFEECTFQDSSGNIWFGSYGGDGLLKYDGGFTQYEHSVGIPGNQIWSIAHDLDGDLLVATNEGVVQYNGVDWTEFPLNGMTGRLVPEIFNDKQGNIWFSNYTNSLIMKYDGSSWEEFYDINGYTENHVWCIDQDSAGNVWFGSNAKIFKYDEGVWSVEALDYMLSGTVYGMGAALDSSMWFGTYRQGVLRYKFVSDPMIEVSQDNWDFGSVQVGENAASDGFWITNNGGGDPLVISSAEFSGSNFSTDFNFNLGGYSGLNNDTLFFNFNFNPTAVGEVNETFTISSNAGTVIIDLHGVGHDCELAETPVVGLNYAPAAAYWYSYTPASDEIITITSCVPENSTDQTDTKLFVYEGCPGEIGNEESPDVLAYSFLMDSCEYCENNWQSYVRFFGFAGVTYKIYWDPEWDQRPFYFDFSTEAPVEGDCCEFPIDITANYTTSGSTETFYNDYNQIEDNRSYIYGNDVVYRVNVEEQGVISASVGGTYATMFLVQGCPNKNMQIVDFAGGAAGGNIPETVVYPGEYFFIISSQEPTEYTAYSLDIAFVPIAASDLMLNVNMNYQIAQAAFTSGTDNVDVVGTFNGWSGTSMSDDDGDGIYSVTIPGNSVGEQVEYKFRINSMEESLPENRMYEISGEVNYLNHWYNNEYPFAAYDVIWSENFDQGAGTDTNWLPTDWISVDANGVGYEWKWANQGPRGRYTGTTPYEPNPDLKLMSTTADNGFLMLEADLYNTLNGELDPNYLQMNAYVQTPPIDLSAHPDVVLKFQQHFRYCCSVNSILSVFISNDYNEAFPDDAHWVEFNTKDSYPANLYSENPHLVEVDISKVAGGQSNVVIRWHMIDASHYFWAIDDVELIVPAQNDLEIAETSINRILENGIFGMINVEEFTYTRIPLSQVEDLEFAASILNKGTEQQINTYLDLEVFRDGFSEFIGTSQKINLAAQETREMLIENSYRPLETGAVVAKYMANQIQADQDPMNDNDSISFLVTESVFARDEGIIQDISSIGPTTYTDGDRDGNVMAVEYVITKETEVNSLSAVLSSRGTDMDKIINGETYVIAQIYEWNIDLAEFYPDPVVVSEPYYLSVEDTMTWITVPFIKDGSSEFLLPGSYYAGFEIYTNTMEEPYAGYSSLSFVVNSEPSKNEDVTVFRIVGNWFGDNRVPYIRLNLGSAANSTVFINVDMNHQIDLLAFDPGVDSVMFWTAQNDWVAPFKMFDNNADGIYSLTLNEIPFGKIFRYKFGINESLESGYSQPDTSRTIFINDLYVEINKIYNNEISTSNCYANFEFDINGLDVAFFDNSLGEITDYLWSFGDGTTSNEQNPVHTFAAADFYEVCLTIYDDVNGCVNEYCDIISIVDTNVVTCNADYTFEIVDDSVAFTSISQGSITNYLWDFGDGYYAYEESVSHIYTNSGYYDVCLTVYDSVSNCMDNFCDEISITLDTVALCKSKFTAFVDSNKVVLTNTSEGNITDFMWSFGDGTFAYTENATHNYTSSGYYDVCLSIYDEESGCFDEFCKTIPVIFEEQVTCNANFDHYAEDDSVWFSSIVQGNITDYFWDFDDGTYAYVADTVHKYNEPGYYNVCLTVYDEASGCLDEYCKIVVVTFEEQAICNADYVHYSSEDTVRFTSQTLGNITDYFWDFDDGHYAYTANPVHIYSTPGYYDVCLTVYDDESGCMDEFCKTVVVSFQNQAICKASFQSYSNLDTVRLNGIVEGNVTDYFWDFGDGTYAATEDTFHIYNEPGYYNICFTVYDEESGCMDEFCKVVVVAFQDHVICNANYSYYSNQDTVFFNDIVSGNITDYFWDFGDGYYSYEADPMHVFEEPGYYEVCFTAYDDVNDCLDEYCDMVVVTFEEVAICNADYNFTANEDTVGFKSVVKGNITDYFWDFDDGHYAYDANVNHIYDKPGYYDVCLTVYDEVGDCMDEYCNVIAVTFEEQAICQAKFEKYSNEDTVRFNSISQGNITDYFWDFGDGYYAYVDDTMHIYEEPGYYNVCLSIYDDASGCLDEKYKVIVVAFEEEAICNADYSYYSNEDTVRFNSITRGNITDYFWDFGDGYYSDATDPVHIYEEPGYYEVCFTAYDNQGDCLDEFCDVVVVTFENQPICIADYKTYSNEDTVRLISKAQGEITDYFWDFDDGTYAYTENVTHIYEEPGYYNVCFTVYDEESGCLDEFCKTIVVTFENQAICKADYEFYTNEDTVRFNSHSQGDITDYMWDFDDGYYAYTEDAMHIYEEPGYYEVRLTVYDDASACMDEITDVVVVTFDDVPDCKAKYEFYTEQNTVFFNNKSIGQVTDYFWSFGDGKYAYEKQTSHQYAKPGYYEVCLTIYNEDTECMDEYCNVVVVTYDNQMLCKADYEYYSEGLNISFNNLSQGKVTDYFWDFDDGTYAYTKDVNHTYTEPGYYEVCLTIYNDTSGCIDDECKVVVVVDPENNICQARYDVYTEGLDAYFTSKAQGAYEDIFWDFDDGTNSNLEHPKHTYTDPGYYEVALTVMDTTTNCFDTRTKVVYIEGLVGTESCNARFSFYPDNETNTVAFVDESFGDPVSWYWDFGDNSIAGTEQNPSHTYQGDNYYRACLTITNENGCQDTYCKIIAVGNVSDASFAYFTYFADSITSTGHFRNKSRGNIVSYSWDFGDGYGSEQEHPSHTYADTGYYAVCLTTTSATNEVKSFCNDVRIGNALANPCLFSCVWPGDANNNLEANHYDIMTIGYNFDKTGPMRDSVSIFWTGHYAQDWSNYQDDGTNNKHADCDGNGVVNFDDTLAVHENFAYSHYYTPGKKNNAYEIIVEWDTSYNAAKATAGKARARMARPTKAKDSTDIYAIGYEIEVVGGEGLLFNSIRVDFDGNCLGTYGENLIGFYALDSTRQMIYVGMSRTDHTNTSGGGHLIDIYFYYKDGYDESGISFIATSLGGIDASGLGIDIGGSFTIDLGEDIEACQGETITLDAGEGYADYAWSNQGSTTNLLDVTESGKYYVTVTDSTGVSAIDSIQVTVHDLPEIDLGDDIESNEPVTLDAGAGFAAYLWQDGSIAQTFEVTETGQYWVQVTDVNGCQNADTILVDIQVGITELNTFGNRIFVYPNPANDHFKLIVKSELNEDLTIELYNMQGQKAYQKEFNDVDYFNQVIDISALEKGVYYMKVTKGDDYALMKLIVQ